MLFEARELKAGGEPVLPDKLRQGEVYFSVLFLDDKGFVPIPDPMVFIGRDLESGDVNKLYFQDFGSYRRGVRYESANGDDDADFQVNAQSHIFEYARALDVLMYCELLRRKAAGDKRTRD